MTAQTSDRSGPGWFVAMVEPRAEAKVGKGIRDELGLETYCPVERLKDRKRGRKVIQVIRPLIPGYVFVAFNPLRDEWQAIEHVDGVVDLLCNDDIPSRIPTAWVEATQRAEAYGVFDRTKTAPNGFKIGDKVKVGEGPFAGHMALIEEFLAKLKSATASKRAKVLVSFMGRMTAIELPVEALERV